MEEQTPSGALVGARVLVTAGPTRSYIDAVRFISNESTGRLGTEIANELLNRGATVTFVHGKGSVTPEVRQFPEDRLCLLQAETISDLIGVLREELRGGKQQVCVHSMAVLDYLPERYDAGKIKSNRKSISLKLVAGPKVIEQVKNISPATLLVGFKLEVGVSDAELVRRSRELMDRSEAEIVVANDLALMKDGQHPAIICRREDEDLVTEKVEGKRAIAVLLSDLIENRLRTSNATAPLPTLRRDEP
jgi:phosphopantothenoylcysteine synthetase/decarboxylase